MDRRPRRWVLVAAAFWALSCGGGGGSSAGNVTIDTFAARYAKAVCTQSFRCCERSALGGATSADCEDIAALDREAILTRLRISAGKGRATFDESAASACVAALEGLTCETWVANQAGREQPAACALVAVPRGADGTACADNTECLSGFCLGADNESEVPKDGTCHARVATGGPCVPTEKPEAWPCPPSTYCDTESKTCTERKLDKLECHNDHECRSGVCLDDLCGQRPQQCYGAFSL